MKLCCDKTITLAYYFLPEQYRTFEECGKKTYNIHTIHTREVLNVNYMSQDPFFMSC